MCPPGGNDMSVYMVVVNSIHHGAFMLQLAVQNKRQLQRDVFRYGQLCTHIVSLHV